MNFRHWLLTSCIFLSPLKATEQLSATNDVTSIMERKKPRPPKLKFPENFGQPKVGASTRGEPATLTTSVPVGGENAKSLPKPPQTLEDVPPRCSCVGCTWDQHTPEVQQGWIQSELTRLVAKPSGYEELKSWAQQIWSLSGNTSKFMITVQMFGAWKLHIGSRETLVPKWFGNFLGPFSDDNTQPLEQRVQANAILGEITKIAKRIALQEEPQASTSGDTTTSVHPKKNTPPKPIERSATPNIHPYTLDTAFKVVCEMEALSKQTHACDKQATETLAHIAGNQAVNTHTRALAYIVLGNGRFGSDSGVNCYRQALELNPNNNMQASAHLGLARAHIDAPTNCKKAIVLAPKDHYIIKNAYIVWGNALASRDYGNNNLGSLLVYFMSKHDTGISVVKRSGFIRRDLNLYDAYHTLGDAAFRTHYPRVSNEKIKQFQLGDEDTETLKAARTFFKFYRDSKI